MRARPGLNSLVEDSVSTSAAGFAIFVNGQENTWAAFGAELCISCQSSIFIDGVLGPLCAGLWTVTHHSSPPSDDSSEGSSAASSEASSEGFALQNCSCRL